MLILLAGVGVVLVGLGVLVLLRFPDRPGGTVGFLGMEVSSIGAGLPLIALGVLAVVVTVMQQPADSGTPSGTSGPANQRQPSSGTRGSTTPGEQSGVPSCMAEWFGTPPEVQARRLDDDAESSHSQPSGRGAQRRHALHPSRGEVRHELR